ncbi:MAG TPA: VWA domain-containing protein [Candidatus Eisenbacteria bacterium]
MRWADPRFLSLLWLVPALLAIAWIAERRRASLERRLGDPASLRKRASAAGAVARGARRALSLLAVAAAVLGLARPQAGFRLVTTTSRGVDLVVVLDLSRSMDARDESPSRLRAAKREVESLLAALEGSPMGLVGFAGQARVLSPLSTDREGLASIVETAGPADLDVAGSDLGAAIRLGAQLLRRPGERPRAIVLVSDGENLQGDPLAAVAAAKEKGARVFTIGVGSAGGTSIPVTDSTGAIVRQWRDEGGNVVITRLDEGLLREIARRGGGRYEHGDGTGRVALRLADDVRSEAGIEARGQTVRAYDERFPWFAALAGLLLVTERLVPRRRR